MSFERYIKRGVPWGFIPKHLTIVERPELNVFPLNVLFAKYKIKNGNRIFGTALYEPDLGSFRQEGEKNILEYNNVYGGQSSVTIEYDATNGIYYGKKVVNGGDAGMAIGKHWTMFFAHLTMFGLYDGEQCKLEYTN